MKACEACNRVFSDDATICPNDGLRLIVVQRDATTACIPAVEWRGPLPGDTVGDYRLGTVIAEGGMGRIFAATHTSSGDSVAIKFLRPEHAARADLVHRFMHEARMIKSLRNPHVVEILDFVRDTSQEDEAPLAYMVMEYLQGEDARAKLARCGPFAPTEVVEIALQATIALEAAHAAGLLHRDLKPDNIFLSQGASDGTLGVKVLDFGAAKSFGNQQPLNLTRPGVAIGTPEYMAPEQILRTPLGPATDVYGLGIVCYELLTGVPPFHHDRLTDLLQMHVDQQPLPLSELRTTEPPVPAQLEQIVMRCLAKRIGDRYSDMGALREALQRCRTAVAAKPRSSHPETTRPSPIGQRSANTSLSTVATSDVPIDGKPSLGSHPHRLRPKTLALAIGGLLVAFALTALFWPR